MTEEKDGAWCTTRTGNKIWITHADRARFAALLEEGRKLRDEVESYTRRLEWLGTRGGPMCRMCGEPYEPNAQCRRREPSFNCLLPNPPGENS